MSTLWDWTEAAGTIAAALDNPDELDAALDVFLADNADLQAKLDGYAGLIRDLEAKSAARKAEADRLAEIAKADATKADTLKARLHTFMQAVGRDKIETAHYRLGVVTCGGKLALRLPEDPATLPKAFTEMVRRPNLVAIREALEAGRSVRGCTLAPRGTRLSIR